MIEFLLSVVIVGCWMAGGQWGPAWRKYGIPSAIGLWAGYSAHATHTSLLVYIPLLLIPPILALGIGPNSWLFKKFGTDEAARWVFAALLATPLFICGTLQGLDGARVVAALTVLVAFQIQAGRAFSIGVKDFIVEDFLRGVGIALACGLVI